MPRTKLWIIHEGPQRGRLYLERGSKDYDGDGIVSWIEGISGGPEEYPLLYAEAHNIFNDAVVAQSTEVKTGPLGLRTLIIAAKPEHQVQLDALNTLARLYGIW